MKALPCLLCLVVSSATNFSTCAMPSGKQVLASLFTELERELAKEPLCNMSSVEHPHSPYLLKHHLATVLATSYESSHSTRLETDCNASKHQAETGDVVDIWDCKLTSTELSSAGETVSVSTIAFGLAINTFDMVPQSLRCF